ncbi:hypothetical protein MIR68_009959 [Amoeboaphelidium protococcarum]|nr:hypothetical protein MIR68_009959 [Amoeboaphelidium protococcarum]
MQRQVLNSQSKIKFGQWDIAAVSELFYTSQYCYGIVNLKPIKPGHVLIFPKRLVKRIVDLSEEECADLFKSVKTVGNVIENLYARDIVGRDTEHHEDMTGLTVGIQDGKAAGQSVFHVHVHIIPRIAGDWKNNDDIYDELDRHEGELAVDVQTASALPKKGMDFDDRPDRTLEDMAKEAARLRSHFHQYDQLDF